MHFLGFFWNLVGKKGCRDTWRIRRVPGGVFRGDSRGCRVVPGWSPGSGHAAQPEVIRGKNTRGARGTLGGSWMWCTFRHSGARGSLRKLPEGGLFQLRHSGQVASSGGFRRDSPGLGHSGTRGRLGKYPGGEVFRSALGNTWHFPKVRPKKVSKEFSKGVAFGGASEHKTYFEGGEGFRLDLRDAWHVTKAF